MEEADESTMLEQIAWYRSLAPTLQHAAGVLLTDQTAGGSPAWDAFEAVTASGDAIVFAFQSDPGIDSFRVYPKGLRFFSDYEIISIDSGLLQTATGRSLVTDGLEITVSPVSGSCVLVLRPRPRGPS